MAIKIPPVTEAEWNECHEWSRMVVEEFLEQEHLSDATLKQYKSGCKIFLNWIRLNAGNKPIYQLKPKDALRYQNYLLKLGLSSSAVKFKRSSVSALCGYIELYYADEEECKTFRNIFSKAIPNPVKVLTHEKEVIPKEELDNLVCELEKQGLHQMVAYVLLSYVTGARRGEIAQMKKEYFNIPKYKDKDYYRTPRVRGKGRGKNGKDTFLTYDERAKQAVLKWLEFRDDDECEYVFVYKTKDGRVEPLSPDAFTAWFPKKFNAILGYRGHPHMLRRTRATHLVVEEGKDISVAQGLLGHASSEVTSMYVMRDDTDTLDDAF